MAGVAPPGGGRRRTVIRSPISKSFALPTSLMTAWQTSGWQSVVKSISLTFAPRTISPFLLILTSESPCETLMSSSLWYAPCETPTDTNANRVTTLRTRTKVLKIIVESFFNALLLSYGQSGVNLTIGLDTYALSSGSRFLIFSFH